MNRKLELDYLCPMFLVELLKNFSGLNRWVVSILLQNPPSIKVSIEYGYTNLTLYLPLSLNLKGISNHSIYLPSKPCSCNGYKINRAGLCLPHVSIQPGRRMCILQILRVILKGDTKLYISLFLNKNLFKHILKIFSDRLHPLIEGTHILFPFQYVFTGVGG